TEAEVTDLNPRARGAVLEQLGTMRTGSTFLPPGVKRSVMLPQFNGGGEWGGAAFDPETRTLFVNSSSEAEWIAMTAAKPEAEVTVAELGKMLYGSVCSACHGFGQARNTNAPSFTSLQTVRDRLTRKQVLDLLETGRGQMPSFAVFTALEKRAVTALLFGGGEEEQVPVKHLHLSWAEEIPFGATGHQDFGIRDGFPANKRPWGTLTAIDLDRGEFRWQTPLGTYRELEAKGA